ncbi:kinase-like protein [Rhizodiscina lignyota]|uniref:mitogen-activated protein kinase kinase n=1 Tax=Rhizodiscina lignyota TaxID=1504668 RepID=A0A9P4I3C3_9PEZI|nr:kinase-like protein [Rhizodiscina lignyota]
MSTTSPITALDPPRLNSRSSSESATTAGMTPSSTPLGNLNAARRPAPVPSFSSRGGVNAPLDIQERLKNFRLGRQGAPPMPSRSQPPSMGSVHNATGQAPGGAAGGFVPASPITGSGGMGVGGVPANFKLPNGMAKPHISHVASAPEVPHAAVGQKLSLAEKRGLKLPGGLPGSSPQANAPPAGGRKKPGFTLSQMNAGPTDAAAGPGAPPKKQETALDKYAEYLDTKTGSLKFKGKAILDSHGVKFAGGTSFSISLDEVDTLDELGKGNYGTVYKVRHSRPKVRRPGLGLAGNKAHPSTTHVQQSPSFPADEGRDSSPTAKTTDGTSGVIMAMKEIRLELDEAKFAAIIMELDILHRCASPYIIDFYGAFFQEGAVYICMEFMDGGSVDKLYGDGVPEGVLRKITLSTVLGLKSLKDEHNIIHRDVKPTNILVNSRGQVKICDFGVSGNLVASIAKTNIGCQSYMAPERISSGGMAQAGATAVGGTYSVQSDIWSLGLTIIECAMGRYPYPPETYNNIFSQLSAIVDGEPPDLPTEHYSEAARNFVSGCLNKIPKLRPTYAMLLQHAWLAPLLKPSPIIEEDEDSITPSTESDGSVSAATFEEMPSGVVDKEIADWVKTAIERRRSGKMGKSAKPALHAAPLDMVSSPDLEKTSKGEAAVFAQATDAAEAEHVEVVPAEE